MSGGAVAAVDLGATSGRVMIGRVSDGMLQLEAVSRFPNGPVPGPDGLHWDFSALYRHIVDGLREAVEREPGLASVGIDSWAVDYGLVQSGELLAEPFHYRDERTLRGVDRVHGLIPFAELYRRNGLQFLPFNTLYQYATEQRLDDADVALLVPDLVAFLLTGARIAERTNASTTGLVDVHSAQWDLELAERLGIPASVLPDLVDPGERLGALHGAARERVGRALEVIAVGSHDTASAIVAVPLSSPNAAYISCGTWGLVGVELDAPVVTDDAREANFTNEGGVDGRVRFLHNVTGLWLLSESVRAWESEDGERIDLPALLEAAAGPTRPEASGDASAAAEGGVGNADGEIPIFDANDPRLSAPGDMPARIAAVLEEAGATVPASRAAFARTIVESIAAAFARTVHTAGRLTDREIDVVHIVGGGALNRLLCQATADRSGLPVLAGPVEATAIGNVLVQARAHGWFGADASLETLREAVVAAFPPERFEPRAGSRDPRSGRTA
ncbi:rhamnulokinase family protein [Microbacterium sp. CFBP9034]|uniref:rhamnulokinase n=1 Tax=Microbacterium sp. CFBP9034 TaxID=3096540 RepID=UPI002A6A1141|nr:rhamnulokinase family protein [Microbacterium sp. CFBP9034]MDY0908404.1 rhamnulokinase family protein [Microbacterium sp. CFBP9034]